MKTIDLETLAVLFRTNDPNLGHVSTLEAMTEAGFAYSFGLYRGIPDNHKRAKAAMRNTIAEALERKAKNFYPTFKPESL